MTFKMYDFDGMRDWLKRCSGPKVIREGRLIYFDNLRYREDYETIYDFITMMGGKIDYENNSGYTTVIFTLIFRPAAL